MDANERSTPPMTPVMPLSGVDADLWERARAAAADHPALDDAMRRIDSLVDHDVEHHPAEFEAVHQLLLSALGAEQ